MGTSRSGSQRRLATIARRQHGVFTLRQLLECGYSRTFVRRQLRTSAWQELDVRVYRVTLAAVPSWKQRLLAATLATDGLAGDKSGGALFGLLSPPGTPEIAIPRAIRSTRHDRPGVRCLSELEPADRTEVDRVPCLAPARLLLELGGVLPAGQFEDVLHTAIVRRIVTPRRLAERATALWTPRRRGCAVVLRLLKEAHPQLWRARNDWEARVLRLFRKAEAPDPIPNFEVYVGGRRRYLDLAWPDHMVAVEFDGFDPHSPRRVFDDDRARQNDLVDAGWKVFRLTSTAVTRRPAASIAPVLRALAS